MCSKFEIYKLLTGESSSSDRHTKAFGYFHARNLLLIQTLRQTGEHDEQKFKC